MRRTVGAAIVVAVVALGYAGASWYVGKQAQETIERGIRDLNDRLNKTLGPDLDGRRANLAISQYKRHVFSSNVVYSLQLKAPDTKPVEYLLSDSLQHGPFPVRALREGHLSPLLVHSRAQLIPSVATQHWFDSLNGQTPVSGLSHVSFSGAGESSWRFRPLSIAQQGESLKFSGGTVSVLFADHFRESTATGRFDSLDYSSAQGNERVQIKGIELQSASSTDVEGASVTRSKAAAETVNLFSAEAEALDLERVSIQLDSSRTGDLLDASLRYDFGGISVGASRLGSLSIGAKGSSLGMDALSALALEYDAIAARHDAEDDFELSVAEAAVLKEKLLAVLSSNPTVSIDPFVWKNEQGESSARLSVSLGTPATTEAAESLDAFLLQIIKSMSLDMSVEKPMFVLAFSQMQGGAAPDPQMAAMASVIFDQYAERLNATGLVRAQDNKALSAVRYENKRVDVNGRSMSVAEFIQRALVAVMM